MKQITALLAVVMMMCANAQAQKEIIMKYQGDNCLFTIYKDGTYTNYLLTGKWEMKNSQLTLRPTDLAQSPTRIYEIKGEKLKLVKSYSEYDHPGGCEKLKAVPIED